MNIDAVRENDIEILSLEGKVDFTTAGALDAKLAELVDGGAVKLLLNFKNVPFIASAGLRVLLKCAQRVQPQGGGVRVCGANEVVREVIEVAGFEEVLKMSETEAEALQSFDV
jgi:anti-anti-sigma factor